MKNDYLKWGALLFALVATASAEYELARAVGFNQWVAAAVPGALDIYTVRALRAGRDVLAAVGAMIGVNAASHLVTAGLLPVNVPLVVAVSAIAPLVLWRVHRLTDEHAEQVEAIKDNNVHLDPAASVERVPEVYPALGVRVPAVPEAVPAGVRLLPIVARQTAAVTTAPQGEGLPEPVAVLAAEQPRTRAEVRAEYVPDPVPEDDDEPVLTPDPLTPRARARYAHVLAANDVPGVRTLRTEYGIGQARAQRIRDELKAAL